MIQLETRLVKFFKLPIGAPVLGKFSLGLIELRLSILEGRLGIVEPRSSLNNVRTLVGGSIRLSGGGGFLGLTWEDP